MDTETIFLKKAAEDNYTDFLEDYLKNSEAWKMK